MREEIHDTYSHLEKFKKQIAANIHRQGHKNNFIYIERDYKKADNNNKNKKGRKYNYS